MLQHMTATMYENAAVLQVPDVIVYMGLSELLNRVAGVEDVENTVVYKEGSKPIIVKSKYIKTVYGISLADRMTVVICRGLLGLFLNYLNIHHSNLLKQCKVINKINTYTPAYGNIALHPAWGLRDYQQGVVDWIDNIITGNQESLRTALIDLPTGEGKTVTLVGVLNKYKHRTLMVLQPRLVDKWMADLLGDGNKAGLLDHQVGTRIVGPISSTDAFIQLIHSALRGDDIGDVIIISNVIMRNYISAWTEQPTQELSATPFARIYPVTPLDLAATLGIGSVVVDEVHENFHANYLLATLVNSPIFIGLSATLVDGNSVIQFSMNTLFPIANRYGKVKPKQHATAVAGLYHLHKPDMFKSANALRGYNHIKYESIILRHKHLTKAYLEMIKYYLDEYYLKTYEDGEKALIYVSSNAMADTVYDYIKKAFPDKSCKTYVRNDPYDNVIKPDIRISSPLKCKSAIDIPNLTTIIMTTNVASIGANIQMLGRGRKLKDRMVHFVYLAAIDLPKHIVYHREKKRLLASLVHEQKIHYYPYRIGDHAHMSYSRQI